MNLLIFMSKLFVGEEVPELEVDDLIFPEDSVALICAAGGICFGDDKLIGCFGLDAYKKLKNKFKQNYDKVMFVEES